jgi:hypothetical protein
MLRASCILLALGALLAASGPAWSQLPGPGMPLADPPDGTTMRAVPVKDGDVLIARAHHWAAWLVDGQLVFIEDDGGGFNSAIVVRSNAIDFGITSQQWSVTPGATYPMQIVIDGQVFSGTAVGTNDTTLQMRDINNRFLQNLYWGQSAQIRVNQYDLLLSLTGSKAIIDAGLRYARGN